MLVWEVDRKSGIRRRERGRASEKELDMKRLMDRWREKERGGSENGTQKEQRKKRGRIERD